MHQPLVDFHCHLDLYREHESVYESCRGAQIELLAVTTTPRAWNKNLELAAGAPNIRVALGLHPQLVAEGADELALFQKYLSQAKYVGEVGLDASPRFHSAFAKQKNVLEGVLRSCSEQGGKILSLHSVRCGNEVLKMLQAFLPPDRGTAVLHWFTGSSSEAKRAAQLGCYFSVNSEMLKSEAGRKLIGALPRERILTETDGPFTTIEDHPSFPQDVASTLKALAGLMGTGIAEVRSLVALNLERLEGRAAQAHFS
jgi:TatD DNase family protein